MIEQHNNSTKINDYNDKYKVKVGDFEGPLDLLLFLIKKSEVNIYDIPISEITDKYIAYLKYLQKIDLDNLTEFYQMAATLLYIKSRMLIPGNDEVFDDDNVDPRKELIEKLIEYQKYKKLSELVEKRKETNGPLIEKKRVQKMLPFKDEDIWQNISVWDLFKSFSNILSKFSVERIIDLYEEVTVKEKISLIYEFIDKEETFFFNDLIKNEKSIMEFICAFLAVLDLVKQRVICIYQNKLFSDIRISPRGKDGKC